MIEWQWIDPATDELISPAAHFLGMTKKDFVAEAARAYLEQRRGKVRQGMIESMRVLDDSLTSGVAALTGLSPERIEQLSGVGDWEDRPVPVRPTLRCLREARAFQGSGSA